MYNSKIQTIRLNIDLTNAVSLRSLARSKAEDHAKLRHVAANLLFIAGEVSGVPSPGIKSASFYLKTGLIWHDLWSFDLASLCFERATDLLSEVEIEKITDAGERKLMLDLSIARSKTAWVVSDRNLTVALLNRAKDLLFGSPEHHKEVANQYLAFGKIVLAKSDLVALAMEARPPLVVLPPSLFVAEIRRRRWRWCSCCSWSSSF